MAEYVVTNPSDVLVSPVAWSNQETAQAAVDRYTGLLAQAQTTLASTAANVKTVLVPVIQRAGGTPPNDVAIDNVVTNEDGTVTITTTP